VPCYHPLSAWQTSDGQVVFVERSRFDIVKSLQLACGQCVGCRLEKSRQWAMRCLHEAKMHEKSCFITLTFAPFSWYHARGRVDSYKEKKYEYDMQDSALNLHYQQFQLFMKRLRKKYGSGIRFYMCGEYGEKFGRPHFHAAIFGHDFSDKYEPKRTDSGSFVYRSRELEKLWDYGFSSVGEVTFESAAYIARYIMKKITGDLAKHHYQFVDTTSGEIIKRVPEFNKMSLKPGIGADWLEKWKDDVYPHDYVIINGKKVKPPKFYDLKFKKSNPYEWEEVEFSREKKAKENFGDNTDSRLLVKETIARKRIEMLKRKI
jgi:hypothetical protein